MISSLPRIRSMQVLGEDGGHNAVVVTVGDQGRLGEGRQVGRYERNAIKVGSGARSPVTVTRWSTAHSARTVAASGPTLMSSCVAASRGGDDDC